MNPNMQKLLEEAKGKSIRIYAGGEKAIQGHLRDVFLDYLVIEASKGAMFSETTYVLTNHIRWINFPK